MAKLQPDHEAMEQAFKEALTETLHEQRGFLHDVLAEVLEDFALSEAICEGQQTELAERREIFDVLEGRA